MARIAATHAIVHPESKKKVLLLRPTYNPLDRQGTFAVLKIITAKGYDDHYAKQCVLIQEEPSRVIENTQGEPDCIIIGNSKELQQVPGHEDFLEKVEAIERLSKKKTKTSTADDVDLEHMRAATKKHALNADDIASIVNGTNIPKDIPKTVSHVEKTARQAERSSKTLNSHILKHFLGR